ncbi:MAG TPA: hypothetical protein VF158_09085 [Longimicrobiales bacterium]
MTTWGDIAADPFQHVAVSADGTKYLDGAENPAADVPLSWSPSGPTLAPGWVYDEVLIAPRYVAPEEVLAIVNLGGPLTDGQSVIDAAARNVSAGHALLNGDGLSVYNEAGELQVVAGDARGLPNVPSGADYGLWSGGAFMNATGLSVADSAGQELVKLGNIAGRAGVPPGVTHGLWGELGTGVYIRGALRLEEIGEGSAQVVMSDMAADEVRGSAVGHHFYIRSAPFTVPEGEVWYVMPALKAVLADSTTRLVQANVSPIAPITGGGGSFARYTLLPGSYDELRLSFSVMVEARTAGTKTHNLWATYQIVKAIL